MVYATPVTTTTAAKFIGQVWSDGCLEAIEFASLLQKRVVRDYEGDIKKSGNTVHIPRLSNLPTQTKTAATDITFTAITEGEQVLTVSTHEYAAFQLESIVQVQSNYDLLTKYQKKIGYALARGREVTLATLVSGFTQTVGTLGVELTADDYNSAWSLLAQAGLLEASPDPGDEFTIALSAQAYAAILKVDTFVNQDYNPANGGAAISRAKIGDIFGAPVFMSNLLVVPAAGQHNALMFHKSHLALAVQHEVPVKSMYMIQALSDAVVGHNIYGSMELSFPPETPGGGAATDNRGVWLKTV